MTPSQIALFLEVCQELEGYQTQQTLQHSWMASNYDSKQITKVLNTMGRQTNKAKTNEVDSAKVNHDFKRLIADLGSFR